MVDGNRLGVEGRRGGCLMRLQERRKQMGEPSAETLPRCSPFPPSCFVEQETFFLVNLKQFVELLGGIGVDDDGVFLIIPT